MNDTGPIDALDAAVIALSELFNAIAAEEAAAMVPELLLAA